MSGDRATGGKPCIIRGSTFPSTCGMVSCMRTVHLAVLFLVLAVGSVRGEQMRIPPMEFQPITDRPWKGLEAKLDDVLTRIFLEPNAAIRYPVLKQYLRTIPANEFSRAFDLCVSLEQTQTPDQLVELLLGIWAERDPQSCWKHTQDLFQVVGIEHGWLSYDGWNTRERITVQNVEAIRSSSFWLEPSALKSFPIGLDRSELPKEPRVKMMTEFARRWIAAFASWPGYRPDRGGTSTVPSGEELESVFRMDLDELRKLSQGSVSYSEIAFEIGLRRWMKAEPASALQIIERAQTTKWPAPPGYLPRAAGPTTELLMLWAKADLPAMIRWAQSVDLRKDDLGLRVRGFLMSRVDAPTRQRWLAVAASEKPEDDRTEHLITDWAAWDPKPALEAALATGNPDLIGSAANEAAYGPFGASTHNTNRHGLGVIREFDVRRIPQKIRQHVIGEYWYTIMELWGSIDVGEAARYGLELLLRTDYAPRQGLIQFFSGHDIYPDEGGMIDRTFCALRVWAVVRPQEMEAWIETVEDPEMRRSLKWLLQNPWGTAAARK